MVARWLSELQGLLSYLMQGEKVGLERAEHATSIPFVRKEKTFTSTLPADFPVYIID